MLDEVAQYEESKQKINQQVDLFENEIRELKKKLVVKSDQFDVLEKEYSKLQEKYRDS